MNETTKLAESVASVIAAGVPGLDRHPAAASGSFVELERRLAGRMSWQRTRSVMVALASLAIAGGAGFSIRARMGEHAPEAITYTVDGRPSLQIGATNAQSGSASASVLSFSDGTRMEMAPRAQGRVVELTARGGRIALDEGRAHVHVAHRPGAEWLFEAGPFLITVHGTAFTVAWTASDSHFELRMETGAVSVKGPVSGGEIVVGAGETLSIGLGDQPTPPAPVPPRDVDVARPTGRVRPSDAWPAELADGRAGAVVADARRLGLANVLATRGSEDLAALADAARFRRDEGLARQALLAQRKRFPGSSHAKEASFLLGRLEDETAPEPGRALAWYDRYLAEAPRGAYVSEALGREMMVLERAHRRQDAAAIAATYLRQFPRGTYAAAAEALVNAQ